MTCFEKKTRQLKLTLFPFFLFFLDWALFTTVPRHRVTWEDLALSAAAGKTVIS
jgi:hypothetical protein